MTDENQQWLEEWAAWKELPQTKSLVAHLQQLGTLAEQEWLQVLAHPNLTGAELERAHCRAFATINLINQLEELNGEDVWTGLQGPAEAGRAETGD
jgi:hypothetical protein